MGDKVGRNAPCPCGSGKKYKNCCMGSSASRRRPATDVPHPLRPDRLRCILWLTLAAAAFITFCNTLDGQFTLDDIPIIEENGRITSLRRVPELFRTDYWEHKEAVQDHTLYRPLTLTSYALNYAVHGLSPGGYHLVNVLLHALVCILLFELLVRLFGDRRLGFWTALLFAVHPIHAEAVASIVGRAELLALGGMLACLLGFDCAFARDRQGARPWRFGCLLLSTGGYAAGLLSKELAIVAPALIIAWELFLPRRRRLFRGDRRALALFAAYMLVALIFLMLRANAVHGRSMAAGYVNVGASVRVFTALRVCLEYVWLLLWPARLSASYGLTAVALAEAPWEPRVLLAVATLAGAVVFTIRYRHKRPAACWGLAFFAITLFPVSNLPFAVGVMKAERLLYSPSAGFLLAVVALARPLGNRLKWRLVVPAALGAVVGALMVRTWVRNRDWHDNFTLAQATLATNPDSPEFNLVMGGWYRERGDNAHARQYYLRALRSMPEKSAYFNLGNIELDERRYPMAVTYYNHALEHSPEDPEVLNNLGVALRDSGHAAEAATAWERVVELKPAHPGAYINLLAVYLKLQDRERGAKLAERALKRFPRNADICWNAAQLYNLLGHTEKAKVLQDRVAEIEGKPGAGQPR